MTERVVVPVVDAEDVATDVMVVVVVVVVVVGGGLAISYIHRSYMYRATSNFA